MYAVIHIRLNDVDAPIPSSVTIDDLDENRESLEFRLIESFANFQGWIDVKDFMEEMPYEIEKYNRQGYLVYCDLDAEPPIHLDYWTIREV